MRLWHKDLIQVLPQGQLIAQWRELSSIAESIQTKGTPNHVLVNFVISYPAKHFISYANEVREEIHRRGYVTMNKVWEKIIALDPNWDGTYLQHEEIYKEKMNETYMRICAWNLYEKILCGGIKDPEIKILYHKIHPYLN